MKKKLFSILFISSLALAQQAPDQLAVSQLAVATGGDEPVGPAEGETYAKYNITQSWELGYRFASVGGDDGKYRSDVNYGDGVRLLSSSLAIHSLEGHDNWFDEITLTTTGLGNDPYEAVTFRLQKNRLYRYDMLWRSNDYFNPGLTVASGEHLEDTTYQWQDHDLTLFPQSAFRIHAGYAHTTQNGPALTTEEEYNSQGDVFPLFENIREQYNEYRLGFDAKFGKFRLTVQHRWEYFKQDSTESVTTAETSAAPAASGTPATLTNFQSDEPYRGRTPGWMGNLTGEFNWITINAKATYSGGKGDFVQNELAVGTNQIGVAQNEQIAVNGIGDRPVLTGDFNLTLFPSSRLTLVSNTSADNTRMTGDDAFTEFNDATLTSSTVNFQFLGIRLVTNSTDLRYKVSKKFNMFGGFRYADRQIRSIEDGADTGSPLGGLTAEQSNHTTAGVAGFNWLPVTGLRMHAEGEAGTNDNPFAPISQRNYHTIRARMQYRRKNVSLGGTYQESYNDNSIEVTSYSSHARSYSVDGSWAAKSGMSFDASYSQLYLDTIGGLAFFAGDPTPFLVTGLESIYISNIHALNIGMRFTPTKRTDLYLGYNLTKDTGDGRDTLAVQATAAEQVLYDVQTFPLTYQTPMARLSVRLSAKLRWNAAYQYYGYHEEFGVLSQNQNYRAHTGYTSLLWAF
jgi:hypothetical protein